MEQGASAQWVWGSKADGKSWDGVGLGQWGRSWSSDSGDARCAPNPPALPTSLRYALASHFFWGLWSILQASMSTIEFGYLVSNPGGQFGGGGRVTGASGPASGQPWEAVGRWGLWELLPGLLTSVWGGLLPRSTPSLGSSCTSSRRGS